MIEGIDGDGDIEAARGEAGIGADGQPVDGGSGAPVEFADTGIGEDDEL